MRLLADISTVVLPKRRVWVNIESLFVVKELPTSFTLCKRVQLWLLNNVTREKKMHICFNINAKNKEDSEYLGNYVWIYPHASDVDQDMVLWGIWFLYSWDN